MTKSFFIVFSVVLFILCGNYLWFSSRSVTFEVDNTYANQDSFVYRLVSHVERRGMAGISAALLQDGSYPPFQLAAIATVSVLADRDFVWTTLIVNGLSLLLTALLIVKIGEYVADRRAGLLAALLFLLYPAVYGLSRHLSLHFALIPAVTLSVYCLLRTESFTSLRWSVLFGVSILIGMNTKHPFIAFFGAPLLYEAVRALVRCRTLPVIRNIALALSIGFCVTFALYCNPTAVRKIVADNLLNEATGPWYRYDNLRVFTLGLFDEQLSPVLGAAFLAGLFGFIRRRGGAAGCR